MASILSSLAKDLKRRPTIRVFFLFFLPDRPLFDFFFPFFLCCSSLLFARALASCFSDFSSRSFSCTVSSAASEVASRLLTRSLSAPGGSGDPRGARDDVPGSMVKNTCSLRRQIIFIFAPWTSARTVYAKTLIATGTLQFNTRHRKLNEFCRRSDPWGEITPAHT